MKKTVRFKQLNLLGSIPPGCATPLTARSVVSLRFENCLVRSVGMEAVWKIEVENFPAFIVIDDKGEDFFAEWLG